MTAKPGKRIIFITGGARSGKSSFAQDLASRITGKVLFVATAEALDDEMKNRIANHRKSRPGSWQTLECPAGIASKLGNIQGHELVLVDCITLLVSNVMGKARSFKSAEKKVMSEISALVYTMKQKEAHFVLVANEVGMGIVPDNAMAREYRDLLGKVNQALAQYATEVYFMVAGIPLRIK